MRIKFRTKKNFNFFFFIWNVYDEKNMNVLNCFRPGWQRVVHFKLVKIIQALNKRETEYCKLFKHITYSLTFTYARTHTHSFPDWTYKNTRQVENNISCFNKLFILTYLNVHWKKQRMRTAIARKTTAEIAILEEYNEKSLNENQTDKPIDAYLHSPRLFVWNFTSVISGRCVVSK